MNNCEWVKAHLDEFADGELSKADTRALEAHLEDCETCRADWESLDGLLRKAAALQKRIHPERDLWGGIAPQLQPHSVIDWRRHARTAVFAAAIAAMAVVAVSLGLSQSPDVSPGPVTPVAREVEAIEPLQDDRTVMREAYHARADALDPELRVVIDTNLTIINDSLNELRRAMELAPDHPRLEQMYLTACRSELDMLRQVVQLGSEG